MATSPGFSYGRSFGGFGFDYVECDKSRLGMYPSRATYVLGAQMYIYVIGCVSVCYLHEEGL